VQVIVAVVFDMIVLATGLVASLTSSLSIMLVAITLSCGAFLVVLVLAWNMFRSALGEVSSDSALISPHLLCL
jgi:bacteriorhodopsin